MPKSSNQKLKLLYILRMLQEDSDENHPLSTQEIINRLAANDISAERKSIYDDMNRLIDYGYDVIQVHSRTNSGYYLASRDFELAELKLLVDAVQASRFITLKKSRALIRKLEKLTSRSEATRLQRQVYVAGRAKTENESIYYSVDAIHQAIQDNVQISFTYLEWTAGKELAPRRAGKRYTVSPWALLWQEENYYLAAYDEQADVMKHYRVDKMGTVQMMKHPRKGLEKYHEMDLAKYAGQTFGMFGGQVETITLQFAERLLGVMLDRFGKEVDIRKKAEGCYTIRIQAAVSGQFFGWLAGIGKDVTVAAPEQVRQEYIQWLQEILLSQGLPERI